MTADGSALRTGWEPDRPTGDTMLGDYVAGWADWVEAIAMACAERCTREDNLVLHDAGSISAFGNVGLLTQPVTGDGAAVAAQMHEFYDGNPGGGFAVFSPLPTPDLRPFGFDLAGHPPMMYRHPGGSARPDPEGLRVELVTAANRRDFDRTLVEAFPIGDLTEGELVKPGWLEPAPWHMWVGYVDDRPVATAAAWVDDRMQHVEWISTRPEHRGHGFGEALTWRATIADPSKPAALVASDDGRPVYERMGFVAVTRFTLWIGDRG